MTSKTNSNGVWVLTSEYNDYDQHGEYFEAVFPKKPTVGELVEYFKGTELNINSWGVFDALSFIEHLRNGGGRMGKEDNWYNLNYVGFSGENSRDDF